MTNKLKLPWSVDKKDKWLVIDRDGNNIAMGMGFDEEGAKLIVESVNKVEALENVLTHINSIAQGACDADKDRNLLIMIERASRQALKENTA